MKIDQKELDHLREEYREAYKRLKKTTDFGKIVSENCSNNLWPDRYSMAASLLFSACMAAESVLCFLPNNPHGRIDHYSAANSCRMIIEHCIMLTYVAEESISNDEIDLRLSPLHLHDASARYRLFKGLDHPDGDIIESDINIALLKGVIEQSKSQLRENKIFRSLSQDKKSKMLGGQVLFVNGSRKAAKLIGYNDEQYDSMYSYFSCYAHGSPMSFYRAALWGVNAVDPVPGQIGVAATAMRTAERPLGLAIIRMARVLDQNPAKEDG